MARFKEYLTLVKAPVNLAVTLNDVKAHARVAIEEDAENADVENKIRAAISSVEGRDGWMGRALITQTWKLILDVFPAASRIFLPLPPLQTVDSVTYLDADGVTQTLSAADYRVVNDVEYGYLELKPGKSWPSIGAYSAAVRVEFKCGYGLNPQSVPADIVAYLKIRAAELYNNREETIVGTIVSEVPHIRNSLDNYRMGFPDNLKSINECSGG